MDYNINFQVAALIIVALLLHHFLTQKKLHNANAKIFTYVLILAGLYILLDRINTLIIINYTPERANGIMLALTGIYLLCDASFRFVLLYQYDMQRKRGKDHRIFSSVCCSDRSHAVSYPDKPENRMVLFFQ